MTETVHAIGPSESPRESRPNFIVRLFGGMMSLVGSSVPLIILVAGPLLGYLLPLVPWDPLRNDQAVFEVVHILGGLVLQGVLAFIFVQAENHYTTNRETVTPDLIVNVNIAFVTLLIGAIAFGMYLMYVINTGFDFVRIWWTIVPMIAISWNSFISGRNSINNAAQKPFMSGRGTM